VSKFLSPRYTATADVEHSSLCPRPLPLSMSRVIRSSKTTTSQNNRHNHQHPSSTGSSPLMPSHQNSQRKRKNNRTFSDEELEFDDFNQPQQRKSKKELCDLGMSCPYLNEYQHRLEFDHAETQLPLSPPRVPFSGSGNLLGGFCVRSDRIISSGNNKRHEKFPSSETLPSKKQKKNLNQIDYDSPERLHVTCDICKKSVDIYNWDMHALSHERNQREQEVVSLVSPPSSRKRPEPTEPSPRSSLRADQDREYESTMMEDILKQSKLEYELYEKELKSREAQEEEALNGLLHSASISSIPIPPPPRSFRTLKTGALSCADSLLSLDLCLSPDLQHSTSSSPLVLSPISAPPPSRKDVTSSIPVAVAFRLPHSPATTNSSSLTPAPAPSRVVKTFSSHDLVQVDPPSRLTSAHLLS
jgi:hypothetical protein